MGVDIAGPVGTPIYATGDGSVETASLVNLHGYGRHVILQHGGFKTLYAHLHKINVQEGQAVVGGDLIGEMGGDPRDNDPIDGASSGAHLHFEVILPSQPEGDFVKTWAGYTVDPLPYLTRCAFGEPKLLVTVLASKGVRVRTEADVNSLQIGSLATKTTHPALEVVNVGKEEWARLWSLRDEFAAVRYGGETLMSVTGEMVTPSPILDEQNIRLNEILHMIAFLEDRKAELQTSQKEIIHAPNG
jgi:hypothetical protein